MPIVACPEVFWWFSGPGEGLRVVLRVIPGSETWALAYLVQFIAVALLASFQAMKQLKFFARLGGAVEVILRENMKPQMGNIALPRKADKISQAEECYQTIGLQHTPAMGASSILILD